MKLFNEPTEILLAKYGHELREPLSRAIIKLADDAGLSEEDTALVKAKARKLLHEDVVSGKDNRFWTRFRAQVIDIFLTLRSGTHAGTPDTYDTYIMNLLDEDISGRSIVTNIYKLLMMINSPGTGATYGVICDTSGDTIEYLDSPQTVVAGDTGTYFYQWGVVGSVEDPEFTPTDPGIYIKGTSYGLGTFTQGLNKLDYKLYSENSISNGAGGYVNVYDDAGISIPVPEGPNTYDQQRWIRQGLVTEYRPGWGDLPADSRTDTYANCQWFGMVPAGSYKLIFETMNAYVYDLKQFDRNDTTSGDTIHYSLIDDSDNVLVRVDKPFTNDIPEDARPTFFRKVSTFTLDEDTNVGLLNKIAFMAGAGYATRFYIVPASTEDTAFSIEAYSTTFSGYSCWTPYGEGICTISVKFTNLTENEDYTVTVERASKLYNESLSIPLTTDISEAINAGVIKIEILDDDGHGNHGQVSAYYYR